MVLGERPLRGGKEANGEVRLNEERAVFVSPLAPGVVRSIRVDLGSEVRQGQVLFEVDSAEFREAKADFLRTSAALDLARATEQRESELFERGICPKKDLLEAQAALREVEAGQRAAAGTLRSMGLSEAAIEDLAARGAPSGLMPVVAPFSGVVLERSLSLGALVQPGDRALLLADTSQVWVITTLYESDVPALVQSQQGCPVRAQVRLAAYPDKVFEGAVQRVGGTLDESTRTARARVVVDNPGGLLRAGMFAKVRLLGASTGGALALPEEAVLQDEGRDFVFVRASGPYFIRRAVTAGPASEGWRTVGGEVKAGDEVVTTGAFMLKSDVLRSKMGAGCAD
jgi:cobalt-zinc-cadmium efflux system membrane fusion protein